LKLIAFKKSEEGDKDFSLTCQTRNNLYQTPNMWLMTNWALSSITRIKGQKQAWMCLASSGKFSRSKNIFTLYHIYHFLNKKFIKK
jgi:hypothetical protein